MVSQLEFEHAREYALSRLEKQLSPDLTYHSLYHTRDDALPAAERLARLEGVTPSDFILLQTAVLYHDIGFTVQAENHEALSAQIASTMLPQFGYPPDAIKKITGMILVTKLFTPPKTILEAIMVDADLDVLGRDDFFKRNQDLRNEIIRMGRLMTDQQWYEQQYHFMLIHRYRTISAQAIRNQKKSSNTVLLQKLIGLSAPNEKAKSNGRGRKNHK